MIKNNNSYLVRLGVLVSPLVLVLALVTRLVLAGTTFHVDLNAFTLASHYINRGEVLSFYDSVRLLPEGDPIKTLYSDKIFNYQPLSYLIPSLFYLPLPPRIDLRGLITISRQFEPLLIAYKLPFIFFDLLAALFITRLAKDQLAKKKLQLLWLFNPAAIFVSSVMGQSDMMVVFFILLSLVAAKKENYVAAALFAGLSALFKPAGLFLLPVVIAAALNISLGKAAKSALAGFGVYLLGILAYLPSISFRTYALLAEQTGKSTFAGIAIASGTVIPWFFIAYAAILILLLRRRLTLFDALALALASSLVFSHFHPQWFVWLTPWLIYKSVSAKHSLFWLATLSWFLILLSFDYSLHLASFWWLGLVPNQYLFTGNLLFSNLVLLARAFLVSVFFLSADLVKEKEAPRE